MTDTVIFIFHLVMIKHHQTRSLLCRQERLEIMRALETQKHCDDSEVEGNL